MPREYPKFPERFWAKIDKTEICWLWTGARRNARGYGVAWFDGRNVAAYRLAYELLVGPIPEGWTLDHLCRNPQCVNPNHLEPVTKRINILRGQSPHATNARKTECPQGHPYSDDNIYHYRGHRACRTCCRERARERYEPRGRRPGRPAAVNPVDAAWIRQRVLMGERRLMLAREYGVSVGTIRNIILKGQG